VKKATLAIFISLVPIVFYQNCGKPTQLEYSAALDLNSQAGVQDAAINILNKHCSECHSQTATSGNVGDLGDIQYLIWSRLVIPGEPEISPIIMSISEGRMPASGPSLSGVEVDILKDWVKGLLVEEIGTGGPPVATPVDPKFSVLQAQIFSRQCQTCHANRNFKFDTYANVIRSLTPGNAAGSILYQAVTVGRTGGKMPQGGALSTAQIKAIEDWINAGAMND
jgi:mono/diheme cytochrome c family protein